MKTMQNAECRMQNEKQSDSVDPHDLRARTKEFAKRVIRLCRTLPPTEEARLIRAQLFRSGTSVGANYRAVCRARSRAEFISKLRIVLEETDESLYWMELLVETDIIKRDMLTSLMEETDQLIAIWVTSLKTAKDA
jgi:four helix bundle protein